MHVLTLIGCVLFSDVGLGDGGGGRHGWRRRAARLRCVFARTHGRARVCGLDEPPEFTLQLWSFSRGRRENEKRRNKVRAGRKSRT